MVETENQITKKLELADTWLTKLEVILRKHWGKLILLLITYFIYWALTQPDDVVMYPPQNQESAPVGLVPDTNTYYEEESYQDTLN